MQLPETFLEQMKLLLGTDYDAWLESYDKKPLVRVIKYWIFALHREAKAQSLEQGFRERDCWFPTISATPGPRRC